MDPIETGNLSLRENTIQSADRAYFMRLKFCIAITLTFGTSTIPRIGVIDVIAIRSSVQMIRIHADRIITPMKNIHSSGYLPKGPFVDESMS